MRMWRLIFLAVVVIGLAPGTFVRTQTGTRTDPAAVTITALPLTEQPPGLLRLTGMWELASDHGWFGGFSALVATGSDGLIAGSDRGFLFGLDLARGEPRPVPGSFRFIGRRAAGRSEVVDLEALARDPATGTLWAAFENFNQIERLSPDGTRRAIRPQAMRDWSAARGPEAMERLSDGRFVILSEGSEVAGTLDRPALIYPGDPLAGAEPVAFRFNCRSAYAPVDATEVPGGRVLILMRRVYYSVPARFESVIMIADPAEIRAGQHWRGSVMQRLTGPRFGENFEGIAFVPDRDDPRKGSVWVIADDNFSIFQSNHLLRFDWDGSGADVQRRAAARVAREYEKALSGAQGPLVICPPINDRGEAITPQPVPSPARASP
jgi:hypothetical protein